jgi:hypothetical protein
MYPYAHCIDTLFSVVITVTTIVIITITVTIAIAVTLPLPPPMADEHAPSQLWAFKQGKEPIPSIPKHNKTSIVDSLALYTPQRI